MQALHRVREQLKAQRTAAINLVRGLLREFGVAVPAGAAKLPAAVRAALEDGENDVPMGLRATLAEQMERIASLSRDMAAIERRLAEEPSRMSPSNATKRSRAWAAHRHGAARWRR